MAKAPKKTANVALTTLAKIAGLLVDEAASNEEVAAVLEAAGLTVAAKGKGKADKKAKPEPKAAKGKKKKITAAQIVEAIEEGESLDLDGVDEEVLREAVIAAKLATKKKAGSLDEEELLELLNEELGGEDDEDGDDEEEEDEDDSDSDDGDDEEDEEDEEDEDDEEDDEDGDAESPDLDELDEDELRELAVSEKVFTKAQAKKKDEDELREALEEHFGEDDEDGDDEEDEDDEDGDDEDGHDLEDLDEDELRALAIEEGVFTKAQAKKKDEDELREALEAHFGGDDDEEDEDFDDEDEEEDDE